ncbi:MAG TPA: GtrA family protein [Verrucomicrobiae bacterium]|nr:GtrA family protein [Verrucomicrobiae bacterium]
MKPTLAAWAARLRIGQFLRFCVVGTSGLLVDMLVLHLLARRLGWNVSLGKLCSAELAMLSNFILNELWTFHGLADSGSARWGLLRRLIKFQAICGAGIGFAVLLLNLFYGHFGLDLYLANFLAIIMVTLWNFWMNAIFNWSVPKAVSPRVPDRKEWENLKY